MISNIKLSKFALFIFAISFLQDEVSGFPSPGRDEQAKISSVKIFEVDELNRIIRPFTRISSESEAVLQNVDRVRLECTSDAHPVQWLYQGHGAPILSSNISFSRLKGRSGDSSTEYVATALISPAKEHHTGKYICTGTEELDHRSFFYIYVPGPTLFSALNGQNIYIPKNDSKILFPCTTSNPDVRVTLEKSINEVLQMVKPSLVTYDSKEGAFLDISQLDDPEGLYVCTARYNNLVRGIEYTLQYPSSRPKVVPAPLQERCDLKCGDNAHCEITANGKSCMCDPQFLGNPDEGCSKDCASHGDCPHSTVCFSDLKCRNPCRHSIRCGAGAECRVENAYPVCFCPENFVGDPKKECFNTLQQDAPLALNSSGGDDQCRRKCGDNAYCTFIRGKEYCKCRPGLEECDVPCESHDDCPEELSCNVLRKCHSPCIHNIICGTGAKCQVVNHRPKCYCPKDSVGDPMKECSMSGGYQGDQPSTEADAPPARDKGKCTKDAECPSNERCIGAKCEDPCLTRRCGRNAICKTADHRTFCVCDDGFEGDANRQCSRVKYEDGVIEPLRRPTSAGPSKLELTCRKPEECGPNSKCFRNKDGKDTCECLEGYLGAPPNCTEECNRNSDCEVDHICLHDTRISHPYCAKVCGKKICGVGATCREQIGVIPEDCECPVGHGGDPYLRCKNLSEKLGMDCKVDADCGEGLRCETKAHSRQCTDPCDVLKCGRNLECQVRSHRASCVCPRGHTGNPSVGCTRDDNLNVTSLGLNPCGGLSCGPHSECRLENGNPTCACRSYARGEPPSCYQECRSNGDCELGLSCVQKQCRHSCSRCGLNTKCLISRNPKQESQCSCLDGFEGDPKIGCRPV